MPDVSKVGRPCSTCKGAGFTSKVQLNGYYPPIVCPQCGGSGTTHSDDSTPADG